MKYGPDIVRQVTEELKKVPNVRHVCSKLGIDHSTFYRWLSKYFEFHQEVEAALFVGRTRVTDAAESVIMTGIQNGDYRSATYWLSHNERRYLPFERITYFQHLEKQTLKFVRMETPEDSEFEILFNLYFAVEVQIGPEAADTKMKPLIEYMFYEDPKLRDLFYDSYAGWKKNKLELEVKRMEAHLPTLDGLDASDSPHQDL